MKKRLLLVLCALVLLLQLLPVVPMAATTSTTAVSSDLYYCREALKKLPNSQALLFAYDNIVQGINASAEEITVGDDTHQLTLDEFKMVLESTRRDHTEQFWMGTSYTYAYNTATGMITAMQPTYIMEGKALADAKVAFEQAIVNMIERIDSTASEYEKEKGLHDMLALKVSYVDGKHAHNAYGALVEGKAVCEGYAEALQCLLQRVGIQSVQVYGHSLNPGTGTYENHAWNMVRIDGDYYLTDLTWNDQDDKLFYAYFNQTTSVFAQDHQAWPIGYSAEDEEYLACRVFELPTCTATEANYFTKNNLRIAAGDYSAKWIADTIRANGYALDVFVEPNVAAADDFLLFFNGNVDDIARMLGLYKYSYQQLGQQVNITFDHCSHSSKKKVEAKPATCTTDGNIEYYECVNPSCQKRFLTPVSADWITNPDSVIILSTGHQWTVREMNEDTLCQTATKCTEHDTYYYICSECGIQSDSYTFESERTGEHAYSETWQPDNYNTHKRPCLNNCGEALHEAHTDADEDKICDVCGQEKSMLSGFNISSLLPILTNPLVLGGGGGAILLLILIAIIRRARG